MNTSTAVELAAEYYFWTGRWILLIGNTLHLDATGNLNVFYSPAISALSSSAALLTEMGSFKHHRRQINHTVGLDWYAGPLTRSDGVFRLMPSQTIDVITFQLSPRALQTTVSPSELDRQLVHALCTGIRNASADFGQLHVALSAGFDSRTILAACAHTGVSCSAYTFEKPEMTKSDRCLPPQLANAVGIGHKFIRRNHLRYSVARRLEFDRHCNAHCVDQDRKYYSYGQWADAPRQGLILRGGCWGFGKGSYYRHIPEWLDFMSSGCSRLLHRYLAAHAPLGRDFFIFRQPLNARGLEAWIKSTAGSIEPNMDFRDRCFWEQRLGCWLASEEQALDITGTDRIHIANSHYILSLLNCVPTAERPQCPLQKSAIRMMAPKLSTYEFNAADPPMARTVKKGVWYVAALFRQVVTN